LTEGLGVVEFKAPVIPEDDATVQVKVDPLIVLEGLKSNSWSLQTERLLFV
jgi:hypothetical protein